MRLRPPIVVLVAVTLGLTACSSSAEPTPQASGHSAAEPAVSPTERRTPAGTVTAVGDEPEGVVYAPASGLVAVAVRNPDRLRLLDGATLASKGEVQLPGHARHLQLGDANTVLVPAEDANELLKVTLPGGQTTAVSVGKSPHDAAETADGRVVVGDEFSSSLTVINNGQVERTMTQVQQPGGVIANGNQVAIVDVKAYTVSTFNPASGTRTAIVDAGEGPTHGVLIAPNQLAVTDTRGNGVLLFNLDPLKETGRLEIDGSPYGIASDPSAGTIWVTLTGRNEVVGLDVSGAEPKEVARYPTVEQPDTVAVEPGSHTIWVTGTKAGVVQRITR
ncbi:MAG: hypothetical protein JWM76_540 [Pseudonocardiales bacterium]|nr:hypothetical protein [Pseudonocardiales bacterium]